MLCFMHALHFPDKRWRGTLVILGAGAFSEFGSWSLPMETLSFFLPPPPLHFTKSCSMEEELCSQFQNQTAVTPEWGPWLGQLYLPLLMLSTDGFMCVDSGCVYLHIMSCGECGSVAVWSLELWGFVYVCISSFRCFMTRQPPLGSYWKQTQQLPALSSQVLPVAFLNA